MDDSYQYFHADHKAFGGWLWNEPSYYSPWMHAWVSMVYSQWLKSVEDFGFGAGLKIASRSVSKVMTRGIDANRIAALGGFVYRAPVGGGAGTGATGWIPVKQVFSFCTPQLTAEALVQLRQMVFLFKMETGCF